jgi:two-component system sensor histidine kinase/response regulator
MSQAPEPEAVVVIDDDYAMRLSCRKILVKAGYKVEEFDNGAAGIEGVTRLRPALVVVDLKMPGISGFEVISRVHQLDPNITVVVITGYATIDTAVEAMKAGAYDFLPKPFSPDELRIIVSRGLERRRLALENQRSELERELLKRRFVTFVSHQLKAPLAAIQQYLQVWSHLESTGQAEDKRQEWLERCVRRTEEMQALIQDWLTLARVERGELVRQRVQVDLGGVIPNIFEAYEPLAAASSIRLDSQLTDGACVVAGDPACLGVLFDNLVSNAIKYNKAGGSVTVASVVQSGEVAVSVADTGIGIAEQDRRRLFEEFFRAGTEGAGKPGGTGLGLAICRRIASEMGGTITVESEPGKGSTFTVRLPAWRGDADPASGMPDAS